ncbi:undecaprenyl-diphosphate phosphatase [Streptococcus cuniculipharyngis]|uniref:Undecaprenyl-diphosphatase n=1 Tax=Streptococcus cuniculipharyngis TaxID=1562651 RepID=A0A5C5SCW8_9STRE|nr:undecaprenyl-diphosphate phosphatase [Streptococcus cuniculipharyngis]TWS97437.1 undecaprenyl-diphosphate phosphatase [Streptococcus cuniculipharyngis]
MLELLKAVFFGVVEGITEWLPISSTGHLILVQEFINFKGQSQDFIDVFNVVIQLGAILAVVVIYFDKLNPFKVGKTAREVQLTWQLWLKVLLACLPVIVMALFLDDWFEAKFYNFFSVALMLIIYGVAFIWIENRQANRVPTITDLSRMPYKTAIQIGLFQILSLMPGTSRSGSTIIGGMLMGTSRSVVTEFTFFLGIPIMFGASGWKLLKFFLSGSRLTLDQLLLILVGMVTAFAVSMVVIRLLTGFVKKHDFKGFGYYRIALGIILIMYAVIKFLFA